MKKAVSLFILASVSCLVWAQNPNSRATQPNAASEQTSIPKGTGKITGMVIDSANAKGVEFATVALINSQTNKPTDGALCDEKGKFTINKIANGSYKVVVTFIGYGTKTLPVEITGKRDQIELGYIKISQIATELKEVVVETQKQLIEEKVDRTIYNAENDQTTKGGDATDVLKRVPMLSVDLDGNVSMRGNSNIRVLINNKPSTITAGSVADALKQIPADQIKSVEVITSPSAKYDAEGSAGIINIITKKNNLQGLTLNMDAGVGIRGSNLSLNGGYKKGKMGFSLGGFGRAGYNIVGNFNNNQITKSTERVNGVTRDIEITNIQSAATRRNDLNGNYTLGWDYDIDKNNSVTASVRYGARNAYTYQDNLRTQSTSTSFITPPSINLRNVNTTDLSGTIDLSLNYTHTFAKPQREFSILTLYSRNDRTNDFTNALLDQSTLSIVNRLRNDNGSQNEEVTLQADYQTPIGSKQLLEFGGKNIARMVASDFKTFNAVGSEGEYQPSNNAGLSNNFRYNQNVTSGYFSYTLSLPKSYSVKAGTRYEFTAINANFVNERDLDIPSYGVVVPSVNFSRRLKNGNTLKAAYNRRIQRPSIQFLNPNRQASNPLFATIGNPSLAPEYTNNYELSYSTYIKGTSLNIATFMRNTDNSIQSVREPKGDTIETRYQNIGQEDAYGVNVFASVNISNKFSLNGGGDVYYAVLKNNVVNPLYNASNRGWVYSFRMFGNYTLNKGWGLQFFTFYRGRQVQLQGSQGGIYAYSLALRKEIGNKKGSVGLGIENFFASSIKIRNELSSPLIIQNSVNQLFNTSVRVTFSYRIGKLSFDGPRKRRRSIDNDDLKSEGSGDGGGQTGGGAAPSQGGGQRSGAPASASQPNTKMAIANPAVVIDATGTWNYLIESPQGGAGKLIIKKEGDTYSGTISNNRNNRETKLSSVTVVGNEISAAYEVSFGGNTMNITIKGTIKEDELNGNTTVGQFGTYPINAKREKK
jgi:outer membrane receptor protein involved in Fe transport